MRKILLLLGFVLSLGRLYAQTTFEKLYDGLTGFKFNLVELPSGNLLTSLGPTRATSILTSNGDVIYTHSYWAHPDYPITGLGGIHRSMNGDLFFAAGLRTDSCSTNGGPLLFNFRPCLGKIDTLGNLLALKSYLLPDGCRNTADDLIPLADGGVVTWGYEHGFFLMRTDNDLTPLWARRFLHIGGFQFVKELPGGDLLAGANMETAGVVIVRLDPEGNVVWSKSYFRPSGRLQDALIESEDSFIITGYTDSTLYNFTEPLPPSFQPKLFMLKLNGEGEIQWCKGYDSAPYYWHTPLWGRIARTQDGNYAVMATLGMPGYALFYRPLLMKTDMNGDTLWTSTPGYAGMALAATDLCVHASGNFYLSGWVWGNLPAGNSSMAYVFKADENGEFSCGQEHHTIEVLDLFPADSAIVLNSIAGVTEMTALLNDTTFAQVTEYNGCTFATNMPPRRERRTPMSIRPNPNTGHFTLSFADPLMAESYYSVYDTMGKLLFQRPLPQGKETEEVDLSRFGAGTYVVRVTSKEGSCYERVVVE